MQYMYVDCDWVAGKLDYHSKISISMLESGREILAYNIPPTDPSIVVAI